MGQIGERLVALHKVAVEIVTLAPIVAGDGAFVVVGEEISDRADVAEAGVELRLSRHEGKEGQLVGGENEMGGVRRGQEIV